jgi:acyl carrier protein
VAHYGITIFLIRGNAMDQIGVNNEKEIAGYIAENILFSKNGYPYPSDASFLENGIIDSMNVLELVMFVEEKFKIKVDDSEIVPENFDSLSKLTAYVNSKQK